MRLLWSVLLIAIIALAYTLDNKANAKTTMVAKAMDKQSFSLIAIKEIKPEGELGVIFVCHKNEDDVRVIPIQPVVDNQVPAVRMITFVSYDQQGKIKTLTPFSTYADHVWNLRIAFNVMRDPAYKGTYAVRLYYADGGYTETRKFTDVELKRITADARVKGCDNDHMQDPSEWEHAGSVDFNVYNKYK